MTRYVTPGGWEVFHGRGWTTHVHVDPGLIASEEGRRFAHYAGTERMAHSIWILDYHFGSGMRYRAGKGRWRNRQPGVWHLYPPELPFWQETAALTLPLHAVWIGFHGGEKLGLQRLTENPSGMACVLDPTGWLLARIRALALLSDTHSEEHYPQAAIGLMEIIQRLLQSRSLGPGEWELAGDEQAVPMDPLVTKIGEYLVAHLHEAVSLTRIAKELHTSVSTLKRRYTDATRESITQALIRLRISRVKHLLIQGATIAEAAAETGFFDAFHLSRTFRRLEGIPPRGFIERIRKQAARGRI